MCVGVPLIPALRHKGASHVASSHAVLMEPALGIAADAEDMPITIPGEDGRIAASFGTHRNLPPGEEVELFRTGCAGGTGAAGGRWTYWIPRPAPAWPSPPLHPIVRPAVSLAPIDIAPYRRGNTGVDYAITLEGGRAGPHALINGVLHGNEIAGAAAIDRLLRLGLRPARGRLTLVLANAAAYRSFDPAHPFASRFIDEDMNRLWSEPVLNGPRTSRELRRARQLRPLYESADALLDLHSMGGGSPAMTLCGLMPRGRDLARRMGVPGWVVADGGHAAGRRLIEHGPFADPGGTATAVLVECGQHWQPETAAMAELASLRFLLALDMLDPDRLAEPLAARLAAHRTRPQRFVTVTHTVTAATGHFTFTQPLEGMEVIPERGTVIAYDGTAPVVTPYDGCVLVMPARRVQAGHTAVRLGYLEG